MTPTPRGRKSKINSPERNLQAMLIAKKKMEEKDFHTSTLNFSDLSFSQWNDLRVYLIEKNFIEKQHITYKWIGGEPTIEMGQEFIEFYKKRYEEKKNSKDKPVEKKSESKDIYSDYLKLKKHNQELTAQNGKLLEELKDSAKQRKIVVEKLTNFINGNMVSKFKKELEAFESEVNKYDYEKIQKNRELYTKHIQLLREDKHGIATALTKIAYDRLINLQLKKESNTINGNTILEHIESNSIEEVLNLKKEIEKLKLQLKKANEPESSIKEELKKISELADYRLTQIKGLKNLIRENKDSFISKEKDLLNTLHCSSEIRKRLEDKLNSLSAKEKSEETISLLGFKIYQKKIT